MNEEVLRSRDVYVVYGNTDCTEGNGIQYPMFVCLEKETAQRLGKGKYIQGSDCPIKNSIAVQIKGGSWLGPTRLFAPNAEDLEKLRVNKQKQRVLDKAQKLGLTDEEIDMLRSL